MYKLRIITLLLINSICFLAKSNEINDSIVSVTASDIKYANLIFVEHQKLLKENSLLNKQITNYQNLNYQLEQVDSIRQQQIIELNKQVKKQNKHLLYWQVGGITVSVGLILLLIFK